MIESYAGYMNIIKLMLELKSDTAVSTFLQKGHGPWFRWAMAHLSSRSKALASSTDAKNFVFFLHLLFISPAGLMVVE
jgi:hypothetical protein